MGIVNAAHLFPCGCAEEFGVEYRNVGRVHWAVCRKHRVRWRIGENLFSSWRDETPATWKENERFLNGFRVVEGPSPPPRTEGEEPF